MAKSNRKRKPVDIVLAVFDRIAASPERVIDPDRPEADMLPMCTCTLLGIAPGLLDELFEGWPQSAQREIVRRFVELAPLAHQRELARNAADQRRWIEQFEISQAFENAHGGSCYSYTLAQMKRWLSERGPLPARKEPAVARRKRTARVRRIGPGRTTLS